MLVLRSGIRPFLRTSKSKNNNRFSHSIWCKYREGLSKTMTKICFDQIIERKNTGSYKWDFIPSYARNAIPMSLADMDFAAPHEVHEALMRRVAHGVYGYTLMDSHDMETVRQWIMSRHGHEVPLEWLLATPGVIYAMRAAMVVMTQPGDQVVVQPPVHTPFFFTANRFGRELVTNPLRFRADGRYEMDLNHLEDCFRAGARLLMICSPHNPAGRVWIEEELINLAELCSRYDARVISDEIHRDLVLPGSRHVSLGMLPGMAERVVTVLSPSKTFNMGGFHIATAVIADSSLREAVRQRLSDFGHSCGRPTLMSITAQTAAYQHGGPWLDALLSYLNDNFTLALEAIDGLPIRAVRPEATYLLWVDCRDLHMNTDELMDFMVNEAGIFPELGHIYDSAEYASYQGPQHHFRLNVAMPRSLLGTAMDGLRCAIQKRVLLLFSVTDCL